MSGLYTPPPSSLPWSDVDLAIKDIGHSVDIAKRAGVSLKVGETALEHLRWTQMGMRMRGDGGREGGEGRRLDSLALYGVVRRDGNSGA